jgi:AcrR family transcriptional regulator
MKTRDKILGVALELFNAEGVGGQSAVDIASAMGISAGHLYYHFKGKPEILAELMAAHRGEIDLVCGAMREAARGEPSLETLWTHVHILVEETWDARFFWRETALAQDHEDLARQARHILIAIRQAAAEMLAALAKAKAIRATAETRDGLSRQIATGVAFHIQALELEGTSEPPRELIARAAAQIMIPVAALAA